MTKKILAFLVAATPFAAMAAPSDVNGIIETVGGLISSIVPIIIAIALVGFLWGIISYITAGDDPKNKDAARGYMIYGIIGLFVMVSVWGLVKILQSTFVGTDTSAPTLPGVPQ